MPFVCSAPSTTSTRINAKGASALLFQLLQQLKIQQKVSQPLWRHHAPLHALRSHHTMGRKTIFLVHNKSAQNLVCKTSSRDRLTDIAFTSAAPKWTLLDTLRGSALYAAMIAFVAVPIWIAQGFLALLGVTLG